MSRCHPAALFAEVSLSIKALQYVSIALHPSGLLSTFIDSKKATLFPRLRIIT